MSGISCEKEGIYFLKIENCRCVKISSHPTFLSYWELFGEGGEISSYPTFLPYWELSGEGGSVEVSSLKDARHISYIGSFQLAKSFK